MASQRNSVYDFIAAVNAAPGRSGLYYYSATLNSDNTSVQVTQNLKTGGSSVVLYAKVLWNVSGSAALEDASYPNMDTVSILSAEGAGVANTGSCQRFLNSLA